MSEGMWILGGAQSDFARNWSRGGVDLLGLLGDVFPRALQDAGVTTDLIAERLEAGRVEAFVGNFDGQQYMQQGHLGAMLGELHPGLEGLPAGRYEAACASGSLAMLAANSKLRAGDIDLALVVGVEIMRSVDAKTINDYLGTAAWYAREANGVDFVWAKMFGEIADQIVQQRPGLGEERLMECLSMITRNNISNAQRNPMAQTRGWDLDSPLTQKREETFAPLLGGRTRYLDCSQVTDGAAMVLLASPRWAAKVLGDGAAGAVLSGWGHRCDRMALVEKLERHAAGGALLPWTARAIEEAYGRAGKQVDQVDVIETHDCFTIGEFLQLSCFGLVEEGREQEAIEEGWIAHDGRWPVNPSGGLIGAGHPVGASGVRMALDLYRQVSGQAGDYQVEDAQVGAMLNIGGSFATNISMVIERAR